MSYLPSDAPTPEEMRRIWEDIECLNPPMHDCVDCGKKTYRPDRCSRCLIKFNYVWADESKTLPPHKAYNMYDD